VTHYPGRWLVTLGYVVWVGSVVYVAACLVAASLLGDLSCELVPGSSLYGEASRSWLPPGRTCTYDLSAIGSELPGSFVTTTPSPLRLVFVAIAIAGLPLLRYLSRLMTRSAPVVV
jgi:hypothetical protein